MFRGSGKVVDKRVVLTEERIDATVRLMYGKLKCIRLWTGEDLHSHFETGWLDLDHKVPTKHVLFKETPAGGSLDWHTAPIRQLVVTFSGHLKFRTHSGKHFELTPHIVLLAEDTTGSGHIWHMLGDAPWRRLYIVLGPKVPVTFKSGD